MGRAKIITALVVSVLVVIVLLQNTQAVETRLLFVTVTMPRALLLLLTLVVGIVVGLVGAIAVMAKTMSRIKGRIKPRYGCLILV